MRGGRAAFVALLRERGIRPRRALGQNFLLDANFREALARDSGAGPSDGAIEIGCGPGNLTDCLAGRAGRVWAFEVDPRLAALARELLAGRPNVTVIEADGAAFEAHVDPAACPRWRVVSNLPYSDWKRLMLSALSARRPVESYTFMVQEDVYDRLRARPGTRKYGPLAALLQAACEVRFLRRAGRELFWPVPRVDSVVVEVRRREGGLDFTALEGRLRALFAQRRKKSAAAGGRRVEALSPAELLAIARGDEGAGQRGGPRTV
jgi:16S rRNA (adenine1518-N6/adenine1519-N6)-dimethyltransferase